MTQEQFANNAVSTLSSAVDDSTTTIPLASAVLFPSVPQFRLLVDAEIMLVTSLSGSSFTVTRGVENTTPVAHSAGAQARCVLTAGAMNSGLGAASNNVANALALRDGLLSLRGNGTTDDSTALAAAIAFYSGTGTDLLLPKTALGYLLAAVVPPKSHVRLILESGATVDSLIPGATTTSCPFYYNAFSLGTSSTTVASSNTLFSNQLHLASVAGISAVETWIAPFPASIGGTRGGIYQVLAVDSGTKIVTLDRPVLWPFIGGDGVSIFNGLGPDGVTNNPALQDFHIIGLGDPFAKGSGGIFTGQCVAYANLVGAQGCSIRGVRGQAGGHGTALSSDAGFAMQIGYANVQEDIFLDGTNLNAPNKGIPLVAQEAFYGRRLRSQGVRDCNLGINDCVDSTFIDLEGTDSSNGFGMALVSETGLSSGIQAGRWLRFYGLTLANNGGANGGGLVLGIGTSFCLVDGFLIANNRPVGLDTNSGANITPCEGNEFRDGDIVGTTGIGLQLSAHTLRNKFDVRIKDSSSTDLLVVAGAVGNEFGRLGVSNDVVAGARVLLNDDTTIENFDGASSVGSSILIENVAGKSAVRGWRASIAANSDVFYIPGGVLAMSDGRASGSNSGTTGIQTNGGTARVGPNNDFSSLGAVSLNSSGYLSFGTFTLGSGAVPWPDLRTNDVVKISLVSLGGTGTGLSPTIAQNPTVGFTPAGPGGDTSVWRFEI